MNDVPKTPGGEKLADLRKWGWIRAYCLAVAAIIVAIVILSTWGAGLGSNCHMESIELTAERHAWLDALVPCWADQVPDVTLSTRLQWQMGGDTFGLVPGYTLVFLLLVIACSRHIRSGFARHLLCLLPVLTGLLDWLENGLIVEAAGDAHFKRLSAELLSNLVQVSRWKWEGLALCWIVIAILVATSRGYCTGLQDWRWLPGCRVLPRWPAVRVSPALSALLAVALPVLTAILLLAELWMVKERNFLPAMAMFFLSLVAVPWWLCGREQTPESGTHGQPQQTTPEESPQGPTATMQ